MIIEEVVKLETFSLEIWIELEKIILMILFPC